MGKYPDFTHIFSNAVEIFALGHEITLLNTASNMWRIVDIDTVKVPKTSFLNMLLKTF